MTRKVQTFRSALTILGVAILVISCFHLMDLSLSSTYSRTASSEAVGYEEETTNKLSYDSEIRYAWIAPETFSTQIDWNLLLDTLVSYNIGGIMGKWGYTSWCWYHSDIISHSDIDFLGDAMTAARARGIKVFYSPGVLYAHTEYVEQLPWRCQRADGSYVDWLDPTSPNVRARWKALIQEVITKYDVDGVMLDYCRYDSGDAPYNPTVKAKFEEYLGGTITNWPGDFAPGRPRYAEFMELRVGLIDDLVRDLVTWAREVKPTIEVGAYTLVPSPWTRYSVGQDPAKWAYDGLIELSGSHGYTTNDSHLEGWINSAISLLGGPEGIIPHTIFLEHTLSDKSPDAWARQVELLRNLGDDGFTSYSYNGPGQQYFPGDYRDYLDLIPMGPIFSLNNITMTPTSNSITISWTTNLPATSKVEYSTSPLFNATKKHNPYPAHTGGFYYWDIDHLQGHILEDTANVTSHTVTLTGLEEKTVYHLRIQSSGSGTATSKVYILSTE